MKKRERNALFYAMGAVSFAVGPALLGPLGCGSQQCADSASGCAGASGEAGTAGSGGSAGSGGGAGSGGSAGSDGSDGGAVESCGGFASLRCSEPDTTYCDYADAEPCGATDGTGKCMPRPDSCVAGGPSVCGCDGKLYTNACEAHRAGTDDRPMGSCSAP